MHDRRMFEVEGEFMMRRKISIFVIGNWFVEFFFAPKYGRLFVVFQAKIDFEIFT